MAKQTITYAELRRMYEDEGMSTYQIGAKIGVSAPAVARYLRLAGVKLRKPGSQTAVQIEPDKEAR